MREIFDRLVDGNLAHIEVEVDGDEHKSNSPWLLSVFIKYELSSQNEEGYEEFLETKESLIIALEHANKAHYLGNRVLDGWNEFYFCTASSKGLDAIVHKILTPSHYMYESNVVRDTKWGFYETQLLPTELEYHHIQSAKIIFLLQEEGDDLSLEREVEHYAVFDTLTQKERFLTAVLEAGYIFKDDLATDEYEHGVALVKTHKPTNEEVQKIVEELFVLIKKELGYYEGWSTILIAEEENNLS